MMEECHLLFALFFARAPEYSWCMEDLTTRCEALTRRAIVRTRRQKGQAEE